MIDHIKVVMVYYFRKIQFTIQFKFKYYFLIL